MNCRPLRVITALSMLSSTVFTLIGHANEIPLLDYAEATCHDTTDEAQPILSVDNDTADLGTIRKDDVSQHSFRIINTGTAPLVILNVYSGCHCTKSEYSLEPVMPGDTTSVKVTFDSHGRAPGYFTKLVRLRSNATPHPVRLYLKGRITE